MWLFDDLLKKPTPDTDAQAGGSTSSTGSATGGSNPPVVDPLATATANAPIKIEKMTESSIVTEAPVMKNTPPPITVSAIDDSSSILVTPMSPPIIATIDEAPPAITAETNPVVTIESPVANIETPTQTSESSATDLSNLFGESTVDAGDAMTGAEVIASDSAESEIVTPETPVETEMSPLLDPQRSSIVEKIDYEHPSDFITASIEKIDAMVEKIDAAHSAKLQEALGYKTEKEKYTELEEEAYADAEKLVEEKEHALSMRTYFVGQGSVPEVTPSVETATSNTLETEVSESPLFTMTEDAAPVATEEEKSPIASVETTLTGLAVASAVTEAVTPPTKKAKEKTTETTNQEPLILAS